MPRGSFVLARGFVAATFISDPAGPTTKERAGMEEITKDANMMQMVQEHPETISILQRHGMGCLGCALAQFETLEQGAMAHGMDLEALLRDLNAAISGKANEG